MRDASKKEQKIVYANIEKIASPTGINFWDYFEGESKMITTIGAMTVDVKIKKLNDKAKLPTRGSEYAAGYDLYACIDEPCVIEPHSVVKIGTGLAMDIPNGYFGAIFARSGLATKKGLRPANCVGVCDADYRGEYIVPLHNDTDTPMIVEPNERIAQLIVMPYMTIGFTEVDELSNTVRGAGGFGSTGEK